MKKYIILSIASVALGFVLAWLVMKPVSNSEAEVNQKKILFYRHPMNTEATSPRPKKDEMGMDYVPVYQNENGDNPSGVVKIDPTYVQNIGVKSEMVQRRTLTRTVWTIGTVSYDETKVYNINSKISGWIEKLYVDYMGKRVKKGDPLMEIYSPDLVTAQQEYLNAVHYANSLDPTSPPDALQSASDLVKSSRSRLLFWDISPDQLTQLEKIGQVGKTMTLYSPYNGVVVDKMVFDGTKVMMGMDLFKIVDLSEVWVLADVYQYELPWVKLNQEAEVELSYLPGRVFKGRVSYIYPMLNMESRTVKVRIGVTNPVGEIELKPEMFADVKINSKVAVDAIVVPDQAIIRTGAENIAVIDLGNGYFDPRAVKLGISADGYVQVLSGIQEGEKIVTSSQFLIDSESNLRSAVSKLEPAQSDSSVEGHSGHEIKQVEKKRSTDHSGHDLEDMKKPDEHKKHNLNQIQSEKPEEIPPKRDPAAINNLKSGGGINHAELKEKQLRAVGKTVYTCAMHPEIISDKPDDCPKCGMKLVIKEI